MAGSSGFWAVFILCNGEREDEGRQGDTHATCHGTGAATPMERRRTAATPTVRRHCDTSKPMRRRTAEAPLENLRLGKSQGQQRIGSYTLPRTIHLPVDVGYTLRRPEPL